MKWEEGMCVVRKRERMKEKEGRERGRRETTKPHHHHHHHHHGIARHLAVIDGGRGLVGVVLLEAMVMAMAMAAVTWDEHEEQQQHTPTLFTYLLTSLPHYSSYHNSIYNSARTSVNGGRKLESEVVDFVDHIRHPKPPIVVVPGQTCRGIRQGKCKGGPPPPATTPSALPGNLIN